MNDCDRCPESRDRGYDFCLWCGNRLDASGPVREREKKDARSTLVFNFGIVITLVCVVFLLIETIVAIWVFPDVVMKLADVSNGIILLLPTPKVVFSISGLVLQIYYAVILIAVVVSVAMIIYRSIGPVKDFLTTRRTDAIKGSAAFEISVLFAATYVIQFVLILVLVAFGVTVESPLDTSEEAEWQNMFLLLEASVWEEIITRVMFIGVPMLIIVAVLRHRNQDPNEGIPLHRYLVGGFGIDRVAVFFILISAFIFGLGHVPGWAAWKFIPSFIVGLAMGYLFVKHGLFAAIGIHFLTDYLMSLGWIMDNGDVLMTLPLLLIAALGIPYVWVYLKRGMRYMKEEYFIGWKRSDE